MYFFDSDFDSDDESDYNESRQRLKVYKQRINFKIDDH